jgi:23S rRNA pseudouridine1911/1915/1917 synthase
MKVRSMPVLLLDLLAKRFPESTRTTLRAMIANKRVIVNGTPARTLKQEVDESVTIEILPRIDARKRVMGDLPYHVVHEDADLLVVEKPSGVITSSGEGDKRSTMIDVITEYYAVTNPKIRIGLVHRLDKDASGLLVFSKNDRAFEALKAQFLDKTAKRIYQAIVQGVPKQSAGTIESKLVELADGSVKSTRHRDYGEDARTNYRLIESRGGHSLLRVELDTGRKHQIRVHLAEKGHPIAGDVLYHRSPGAAPRLMLAAVELTLTQPRSGKSMTFTTPIPAAMSEYWASLKA